MNTENLPNILKTWETLNGGIMLRNFDEWLDDHCITNNTQFASDLCAKTRYLTDMLSLVKVCRADPNLLNELNLAHLSLVVTGNTELANKFILGYRLGPGMDDEYVKRTRCYG